MAALIDPMTMLQDPARQRALGANPDDPRAARPAPVPDTQPVIRNPAMAADAGPTPPQAPAPAMPSLGAPGTSMGTGQPLGAQPLRAAAPAPAPARPAGGTLTQAASDIALTNPVRPTTPAPATPAARVQPPAAAGLNTPTRANTPAPAPAPALIDPMQLANPFARPDQAPAPAPAPEHNSFTRGFLTAAHQLPELGGATVAYAGDVLKKLGADNVGEAMLDYGLDVFQRHKKDTEALSRDSDSFSYAMKHPSALGGWLAYAGGYTSGQAVEAVISMVAGAALGSEVPVVGNVAGAAVGLVERKTIERAALKAGEKLLQKKLAEGVAAGQAKKLAMKQAAAKVRKTLIDGGIDKKVAHETVQRALARRTGRRLGAAAAAGALNESQELGSVYGDAREQAQQDGRALDGADLARIGVMATAAAGVDTLAELVNLSRFMKGARLGSKAEESALKRRMKAGLKEIAAGAAREGGTEATQTVLERVGAGQPVASAEGMQDIVDSAALGVVGGGLAGAGAGLHAQPEHAANGAQPGLADYRQRWQQAKAEVADREQRPDNDITSDNPEVERRARQAVAEKYGVAVADLDADEAPTRVPEVPAGETTGQAPATAPAANAPYPNAAPGSLSDAANAIPPEGEAAPAAPEPAPAPAPAPTYQDLPPPEMQWVNRETGEPRQPTDQELVHTLAEHLVDRYDIAGTMRFTTERVADAWGVSKQAINKARKAAVSIANKRIRARQDTNALKAAGVTSNIPSESAPAPAEPAQADAFDEAAAREAQADEEGSEADAAQAPEPEQTQQPQPTEAAPSPGTTAAQQATTEAAPTSTPPDTAFNGDLAHQLEQTFRGEEYNGKPVPLTNVGFRPDEVAALEKAGLASDGTMNEAQFNAWDAERGRRLAPSPAQKAKIKAELGTNEAERETGTAAKPPTVEPTAEQEPGTRPPDDATVGEAERAQQQAPTTPRGPSTAEQAAARWAANKAAIARHGFKAGDPVAFEASGKHYEGTIAKGDPAKMVRDMGVFTVNVPGGRNGAVQQMAVHATELNKVPAPTEPITEGGNAEATGTPAPFRMEPRGEHGLVVHGDPEAARAKLKAAGFNKRGRALKDGTLKFSASDRDKLANALGINQAEPASAEAAAEKAPPSAPTTPAPTPAPAAFRVEPKGAKGLIVHGDAPAVRTRLREAGFVKKGRALKDGRLRFDATDRAAIEAALGIEGTATPAPAPEPATPPAPPPAPTAETQTRRTSMEAQRAVFREITGDAAMRGKTLAEITAEVRKRAGEDLPAGKVTQIARAAHKELKRKAAALAKASKQDPSILAGAMADSIDAASLNETDPKALARFRAGFQHAVDGRTRSTIVGEGMDRKLDGYDAAQKWLASDMGRAWRDGSAKKLKNTGVDLRRWYEQHRKEIEDARSSGEVIWHKLKAMTTRATLFPIDPPEGATPGETRYLELARKEMKTFADYLGDWIENMPLLTARYTRPYMPHSGSRSRYGSLDERMAKALDRILGQGREFKYIEDADAPKSEWAAVDRFSTLDKRERPPLREVSVDDARAMVLDQAKSYIDDVAALHALAVQPSAKASDASVRAAYEKDDGLIGRLYRGRGRPFTPAILAQGPYTRLDHILKSEDVPVTKSTRATPVRHPRLDRVRRKDLPDYRGGKDVSPERFKADLGFADVGFGKWVGTKEDQDHLNYAYDAFMDLAHHFGIPPTMIGFEGKLHFTIGALGHGHFAAHFQAAQPVGDGKTVAVINVTKTRGDGTLYHEWGHAFDLLGAGGDWPAVRQQIIKILSRAPNTAAQVEAAAQRFLTGGTYWVGMKRMPKVQAAIRALQPAAYNRYAMRKTSYMRAAQALDGSKSAENAYWANDKELFARAIEAWSSDTLDGTDTYLVNPGYVGDGIANKESGYRGTPYPRADERQLFNQVLTALAKATRVQNGRLQVSKDAFEAALPAIDNDGEARRQELLKPENMQAFYDELLEDRAQKKAEDEQAAAAKARADQELMDRLAQEAIDDMGPPAPSATMGPLTDADYEAIFDEAAASLREQSQEDANAPAPGEDIAKLEEDAPAPSKPSGKASRKPSAAPGDHEKAQARTAAKIAAAAAKEGVTGLDEAMQGLVKLFGGGNGRLNSFPAGFDKAAYAAAKPHFAAALKAFQASGKDLADLFRFLIQQFGDGIKMYAVQFAKEEGLGAKLDQQAPHAASTASAQAPAATPSMQVAGWVRGQIEGGTAFTSRDLFRQANEAFGGTQAEGAYTPKDAYDALEAGVNRYLADNDDAFNPARHTPEEAMVVARRLREMLAKLPTQTKRTAETDEFQQYSTVPPLAYLANWVAGVGSADTVLEPSAGIGGIAVFGRNTGATMVLNELSSRRAGVLQSVFPDARVFHENAEQLDNILPEDVAPTVVVMNPPFSATAGREQGARSTKVGARHIEQALARLVDGGRLVGIVGKGMALDSPTFRQWWKTIRAKYDVRAVVPMAGKGYAKYGTTFDNVLIVIDKAAPNTARDVVSTPIGQYDELVGLLSEVRNDRPQTNAIAKPDTDRLDAEQSREKADARGEGASVGPGRAADDATAGAGGVVGSGPSGKRPVGGAAQGPTGVGESFSSQGSRGQSGRGGRGGAKRTHAGGGGLVDAAPAGGSVSGAEDSGVNVENIDQVAGELTDSVFEPYTPQRLRIEGAKAHPGPLVQSAAMSSVLPPKPTYTPNLPASTLNEGKLSIAQLEAVVYAGQAHAETLEGGERRGFFIGDGTGVGKGREISGIMLDNLRRGRKKAVWISQSQDLMTDAKRDLEGAGGNPDTIFNLSKHPAMKKDAAGTPHPNAIDSQDGVVFTTYATLRSGFDAGNRKRATTDDAAKTQSRIDQLVHWLGEDFDGVIAFDEAHNAGNALPAKGKRGKSKPSAQALAVVALQKRLPKARVVYVSATGATEIQNYAYATRLGLWGPSTPFADVSAFTEQMRAGGLAALELVARDMKQMGVYIARSLSFDGVTYSRVEHPLSDLQHDIYNRLAEAWQVTLQNFDEALAATGAVDETGKANDADAVSAAKSAYWGAQQRFFNQVLTAMQMPSVLDQMERDLADGKSLVLQLVNTNEAQTKRALAKRNAEGTEGAEAELLDLTPREQLTQMVEHAFPVQQYETFTDENGNKSTRLVRDTDGNPVLNREAVKMRDKLLADLKNIRVPDGPLEAVLDHFGADQVAEVTGRKRRVVRVKDEAGNIVEQVERRGKTAARADAKAFMGDKKRILVFSDAGGTGFSFHADRTARSQRRRMHYLIQPGWRADKAVQGFGRTHRTNQASAPHYYLAATDVPAHKRFLSSIARRLDQLGALTKGQRDTANQGLFSEKDNLESNYAHWAIEDLFKDAQKNRVPGVKLADLLRQMGLEDIVDAETGELSEAKIPATSQFLNRMLSLNLGTQERVFAHFIERMETRVDAAIAAGEIDTGMETIRALETKTISDDLIHTDPRSGAQTRLVGLELTLPNTHFNMPIASEGNEFVVNKRSGRVYYRIPSGSRTTRTGQVVDRYRMLGTNGQTIKDATDFEAKAGAPPYKVVSTDEARALWQKENEARPQTITENEHMVTGAVLPIWDRLDTGHGSLRVVRTQTSDGKRLLGRLVPPVDLPTVRKRFALLSPAAKLSPSKIMAEVLRGKTAELANGWTLERAKVADELRVELKGIPAFRPPALDQELADLGVITERIDWRNRLFVPTTADGVETLTKLFASKPVVDLLEPEGKDTGSAFMRKGRGSVATAGRGRAAATVEELDAIANRVRAGWRNAPTIRAVRGFNDLPAAAQRQARKQGSDGSDVAAVMHRGTVYLVASHPDMATREGVEKAIFHEVWGHYGLRMVFGKDTHRALNRMATAMGGIPGIMRYARTYGIDLEPYRKGFAGDATLTRGQRQALLLDELAAHIAQSGPPALRQRLREYLGAIKAWLRAHGFTAFSRMSDLDLAYTLKRARDQVVNGTVRVPGQGGTSFQRSPTSAVDAELARLMTQYTAHPNRPSEAEVRAAVSDYRDTERTYGGREGYERAKGAGQTNLNYGQWVQVRTQHFRRWFGNWQAAAGQAALRSGKLVAITGREFSDAAGDDIDMAAMRQAARAFALENVAGKHTNASRNLAIEVRPHGIDEAIAHHSGPDKLRAFAAIPSVLRDGVVVFDDKNPKNPRQRLIVIAKRVRIGNEMFLVSAGIREDSNGRLFYDHEMLDVKKAEARLSSQSGAAALPGSAPSPASARLNDYTVAFMAQEVDSSQVVDPETGEPLVVYHGSGEQRTVFEPAWKNIERETSPTEREGNGDIARWYQAAKAEPELHFFAENEGTAESYGGEVTPAFLNIRNPAHGTDNLAAVEAMLANGNDGAGPFEDTTSSGRYGGLAWVARKSNQIKSATDNIGTFSERPDIMFSLSARDGEEDSAPFYSQALRTIEAGKGAPNKASAGGWKQWLDGAQKRGGMKKAEREWLGIDQWLDGQEGKVSREALAQFVADNQVEVKDVTLGSRSIRSHLRALRFAQLTADQQQNVFGHEMFAPDEWVVYDGDEMVLTAPGRLSEQAALDDTAGTLNRMGYASDTKFEAYTLPGGEDYHELLMTLPAREGNAAANFKSGHFEQPNILAHARFDTRHDADGKKVLFLEEIQSDWHQEGRKRGYGDTVEHGWTARNPDTGGTVGGFASEEEARDWIAHGPREDVRGFVPEKVITSRKRGVPDAPFKRSQEWSMLAFKRMARWAAEHGYDRIAWTTGEQQAARYDLSAQIDALEWYHFEDGPNSTYQIVPVSESRPLDLPGSTANGLSEAGLADAVGKDVAERIINAAKAGATEGTLSGLDLKVGGKGMTAFYDRMLPNEVKKWAKPFGATVGETTIDTGPSVNVAEGGTKGRASATVHSLDVTPAMREAALGGQPLFSEGKAPANAPANVAAHLRQVNGWARELTATWGANQPRVRVIHDAEMLPARAKRDPLYKRARGYYDGSKVWLIANNLRGRADTLKTLTHEAVGHYGVERIIAEELGADAWSKTEASIGRMRDKMRILRARNLAAGRAPTAGMSKMQTILAEVEHRYGRDRSPLSFAKETLAVMSEHGVSNVWMDRAVRAIRQWLRKVMPGLRLSTAELRQVLARSDAYLHASGAYRAQVARVRSHTFATSGSALPVSQFLDGEPVVAIQRGAIARTGGTISDRVMHYYRANGIRQATHPELGAVDIKRSGVKASIAHGIGADKVDAFAAVPDIIRHGRVIDETANYGGKDEDRFVLAAPIRMDGEDYLGAVVIRRDPNGQRFYLHEVVLKEKLQAPFSTGASTNTAGAARTGGAGAMTRLLRDALDGKMDADHEPSAQIVKKTTIAGGKFGDVAPPDARHAARARAYRYLERLRHRHVKITNAQTGWQVGFSARGNRELKTWSASPERIEALAALPALIRRAVLGASRANPQVGPKDSTVAFHYFYAPLRIGGTLRIARLVVREEQDGNYAYDLQQSDVSDMKNPAGASRSPAPKAGAWMSQTGPDPTIAQLREAVNAVSKRGWHFDAPPESPFSVPNESVDTLEDVMAARKNDQAPMQRARDWVAGKFENIKPALLGALQTRNVLELMEHYKPLKGAKSYAVAMQRMDADREQMLQGAPDADAHPESMLAKGVSPIMTEWRKWAFEHGVKGMMGRKTAAGKETEAVMHEATQLGMDPSEDYRQIEIDDGLGNFAPWTKESLKARIKHLREVVRGNPGDDNIELTDEIKRLKSIPKREQARKQGWPALKARYDRLPQAAKKTYREIRDWYREHADATEDALVKRIEAYDMPETYRRSLKDRIRLQFERARREGVYFPLNRNGDFWAAYTDANGAQGFLMVESAHDLTKAERTIKERGWKITATGRRDQQSLARNAPSGTFVKDIIQTMKKAGVREQVQNDVYQLFLKTLPEMSMRTRHIRRKGVPGFSGDAMRAFAKNGFHGSYQLARLRWSQHLEKVLESMQARMEGFRSADELTQAEAAPAKDVIKADALLAELGKRHERIMNPVDSKLANRLTSIGFLYYLGASPASALVNLTQGAQVTLPALGAAHGWGKASRALGKATMAAVRTGGNIAKTLTSEEEKRALMELIRRGDIDRTQGHTLAAVAEGNDLAANPQWERVMRGISWMFHKSEVVNREAAGMAAYRLARSDGRSVNEAIQYASDIINGTQFDYSAANRPRYMEKGWQKVLLQFKSYSYGMTWLMYRNLYQAFKGESPEVRRVARRTLTGVLGMTALMAGVVGLPIINLMAFTANAAHALWGDDDEPWDFLTEFRAWLNEHFGETAGSIIAHGAADKLGASISTRVSLSDLWFRDSDRELEGRDAYYNLLETLAGPMGGIAKNWYVGNQEVSEGHVWRGVERMMPTVAKNGMKAFRYASQGVNTLRGDPIVPDVSGTDQFMQALGFWPTHIAEQQRENSSIMNYQQQIGGRRQALMNAYAMSIATGDGSARNAAMGKIRQFNRAWPQWPITTQSLKSSLRSRARHTAQAVHGMPINKRLRGRLEEMVQPAQSGAG